MPLKTKGILFDNEFGNEFGNGVEVKTSIRNKQGIVDWIYERATSSKIHNFLGLPKRQIEELVPVLEEGETPLLTISVITFESGWNYTFTSKAGAIGLGGVLPSDVNMKMLKETGIIKEDAKELYLPEVNIRATQFMINHMRKHGDGDIDKCFRYYRGLKRDKNGNPYPSDLKKLEEYTTKILKAYWQLNYINAHPELNKKEINEEREVKKDG